MADTHITNENGKWFLRPGPGGARVLVSQKIAPLIREMLEWEERRSEDGMEEKLRKINCHKSTLYLAGRITKDELIFDPRLLEQSDITFAGRALALGSGEFVSVENETELREFAKASCEVGKLYIGQIWNTELGHSFVVGKAGDGQTFVCFDKAGFRENPEKGNKDYKFRVYEIAKLLENEAYQKAQWRFVPVLE